MTHVYKLFRRRQKNLSPEIREKLVSDLAELQEAILNREAQKADRFAKALEIYAKKHLKRSSIQFLFDAALGIGFTIVVAILIRQTIFEPYEIPSGSMRPTFKEQDKLIVSKTQFGINLPLSTGHLAFHPEEMKRMGVVVFTGENMDIPNVKTHYFYLLPGHKQYIKRMIGLPGDTLYFYGGKIYGIDREGRDISHELQNPNLSYLEHIPFIYMEGKAITSKNPINEVYTPVVLYQMHMPLAKMHLSSNRGIHHELLSNDQSDLDLYDLWGMGNFATTRIVPRSLVEKKSNVSLPQKEFYLEINHHPSVRKATIKRDAFFRVRPTAHSDTSYIPLDDTHMRTIWDNIYTGRFVVDNGFCYRYGLSDTKDRRFLPKLPNNVPNGTYEFTAGKLYQVGIQGMLTELPKEHPLASYDPMKCFLLFNAGIECDTRFLPTDQFSSIQPVRYGYFRSGDLYVMGAPILKKGDPVLEEFISSELKEKARHATYVPFIDGGAPLKQDGSLDIELIKKHGMRVPEKQYFVLGDNHAMSGDSREFGFVPEDNIRGVPLFLCWAPGGRFGFPNHGLYSIFTLPRLYVWLIVFTIYGISKLFYRTRKLRLQFD